MPVTNVSVTDNQNVTPTYVEGDTDGDGKLDIGEKWTFEANDTARPGQYNNEGIATANYSGTTVTSEDESHYFGKLSLKQRVSDLENKTEELQENVSELREELEEQNETIEKLKENQTILMVWKEEVNQFMSNTSEEIENLWNETESIWSWLEEHIPPGLQESNPGKNKGGNSGNSEKAKDKGKGP